jgi:hypothetical protein
MRLSFDYGGRIFDINDSCNFEETKVTSAKLFGGVANEIYFKRAESIYADASL